jgi:hypothetical protein
MPRFVMFIEDTKTTVRSKEFEAEDLEEAQGFVESDTWDEAHGWDESDVTANAEIREDLCYEMAENPRERDDDDGVEYGDPRDRRDELL